MTDQFDTSVPEQPPQPVEPDLEPTQATIVEPAPPPIEAALSPVGAPARLSARVRWSISLLVVALVIGATAVAFAALSGGSSLSTLAGWAPVDTYAYGEVRLDLPGDQKQAVADLLSHFPGFADESSLDSKVSQALDRIITDASQGRASYSEIQPWLGDAAAVALHGTLDPSTKTAQALVAVSITDATKARAFITSHDPGAATETSEPYGGVQLTVRQLRDGTKEAYAILPTVVLAGDEASVKEAIDSKGTSGFADVPNVKAAVAAIDGTPLGFAYIDLRRVVETSLAASPAASALVGTSFLDRVPPWVAMTARARSDGIQVDVTEPAVQGMSDTANRTSTLASRLPATTVAAFEVRDLGARLRAALDQLKSQDATKEGASQLEQGLALIGGFDNLVGWAGDASFVVTAHDGAFDGGLVVQAADEGKAASTLAMLRNLASLAGGSGTASISIRDEAYGDGTITVVDLGDAAALGALGGGNLAIPAGTRVSFAYTVQKGLFVIGSTDAFVKSVVDTTAGSSLADQGRSKQAIDRAGASNAGQGYVDFAGIANAIESMMPPDARARYESDVKPYVTPLGAIAGATTGGDPRRMRLVVTVQ